MNTDEYLLALEVKLRSIEGYVVAQAMEQEIDANIGLGYIRGSIVFFDGSRLEFTEQLPPSRRKYRIHLMNADDQLLVRWDSAPHHQELSTYPFHKHTMRGVEVCKAVTVLEALDEIIGMLSL